MHPLDVTDTSLLDTSFCVGTFVPQDTSSIGAGQLCVMLLYRRNNYTNADSLPVVTGSSAITSCATYTLSMTLATLVPQGKLEIHLSSYCPSSTPMKLLPILHPYEVAPREQISHTMRLARHLPPRRVFPSPVTSSTPSNRFTRTFLPCSPSWV